MELETIKNGKFRILNVVGHGIDTLYSLPEKQYGAYVNGLLFLLDRVSERGPKSLSKDQCHLVDQNNEIYEFIRGKLRLLWFSDKGGIVICAHGFVKKNNKTPSKEKNRAIDLRNEYMRLRK